MKDCGVKTPFKGVRVYLTAAMGMPGSETALEEVVCRVFGSLIQDDKAVKIADNLFCGGNTLYELCANWEQVLKGNIQKRSPIVPSQTIINPKSKTILGWKWSKSKSKSNLFGTITLHMKFTTATINRCEKS